MGINWELVIGFGFSTASIVTAVILSNRSIAHQNKVEAEKLAKELSERVAVLDNKIENFAALVKRVESSLQRQIDEIKDQIKELRREKSVH